MVAAGPLLVASITPRPFAVAMAFFAQRLPWFLFGLVAGAIIDRVDRKALVISVDLCRAAVLALLAAAIAFDVADLPVIYVAMFLLGTAETVADNASSALIPATVPGPELGPANARLMGSMIAMNQLAGPPLGAFIFTVGAALPFGFNAACFLLAVALISRVKLEPKRDRSSPGRSMPSEVMDGLRWLWSNPAVRTLAVMITAFNVTFGAAYSIWVLYSYERLGLDEFGYGVLMAASAAGGVLGSLSFGWLEKRFSYAILLRVGLIIETVTHLALALTSSPVLAGLIMALFGAHAIVWGTTSTTIRHRAVPPSLLGRVTSVYLLGGLGALALGGLLGGVIGHRWGVTGPFWFAFIGSGVILAVTWRSIAQIAHAGRGEDDRPSALSRVDAPFSVPPHE